MRVEAEFVCPEILGPMKSGDYEVPDDAAILDLLEISRTSVPGQAPEINPDILIFLKNGKPAQADTRLAPGDKVHIMRMIFGG